MPKPLPSPETLRKLLSYDPDTGSLKWKERERSMFETNRGHKIWNARYAGKEAFTYRMPCGHAQGAIFNVNMLGHRVAWAVYYGEWPRYQIDHINGIPDDNRISNLRDVPQSENMKNICLNSRNTSGVSGVSWCKRDRLWYASIKSSGVNFHLGAFKEQSAAISARKKAEKEFGFHANHGRLPRQ